MASSHVNDTQAWYAADRVRYPWRFYEEKFLCRHKRGGQLRLLRPEEKEELLTHRAGHTFGCVAAAERAQSERAWGNVRSGLLATSCNAGIMAFVVSHRLKCWGLREGLWNGKDVVALACPEH